MMFHIVVIDHYPPMPSAPKMCGDNALAEPDRRPKVIGMVFSTPIEKKESIDAPLHLRIHPAAHAGELLAVHVAAGTNPSSAAKLLDGLGDDSLDVAIANQHDIKRRMSGRLDAKEAGVMLGNLVLCVLHDLPDSVSIDVGDQNLAVTDRGGTARAFVGVGVAVDIAVEIVLGGSQGVVERDKFDRVGRGHIVVDGDGLCEAAGEEHDAGDESAESHV